MLQGGDAVGALSPWHVLIILVGLAVVVAIIALIAWVITKVVRKAWRS